METEQHQQLVSKRMEFKTKGIGAVAMTGKPVSTKVALKFLDPILALSSVVIAVIDLFGFTRPVGDDKADSLKLLACQIRTGGFETRGIGPEAGYQTPVQVVG